MDIALAEDYETASANPNFFENYKAKKNTVEKLMEEWTLLEEKMELN